MELKTQLLQAVRSSSSYTNVGRVIECRGPVIRAVLPGAEIGEAAAIVTSHGKLLAVVSAFSDESVALSPLGSTNGIRVHDRVELIGENLEICFDDSQLDQVLEAVPVPSSISGGTRISLDLSAIPLSSRAPLREQFLTGIRSIDLFTPVARGQRLLIASEPGVGKTTLLQTLAQNSDADLIVIGLIGERGREAAEVMRDGISSSVKKRMIVVISTSDELATKRRLSAITATKIAEHFCNKGKNVLLLVDSLTRFIRAARDEALAAGELPVRRGYPASIFSILPQILERPGKYIRGSITAFYTMLLTSSLDEDPMIEEVRGILDGHLILRRELAESGIFPALSVNESLSRIGGILHEDEDRAAASRLRCYLEKLKKERHLALFAERPEPELAVILEFEPKIREFLSQPLGVKSSWEETTHLARELISQIQKEIELRCRGLQSSEPESSAVPSPIISEERVSRRWSSKGRTMLAATPRAVALG